MNEVGQRFLAEQKELGIITDLDPHKTGDPNGLLLLSCGDADISCGLLDHVRELSGSSRIHQISVNGGALNLAQGSPLPRRRSYAIAGVQLMHEIKEACELKNLTKVAICAHSQCGAAHACGLTEAQAMQWAVRGKLDLRRFFEETGMSIPICSMMHVRWKDRGPRLYFLDARRYADHHRIAA